MLAQAIEAEVAEWIDDRSADLPQRDGHRQVVRNGYLPKRTITTGVGPVEVQQPRVLDRRRPEEAEPFSSKILPPYLRKTKSLEELIPWLYLKGVSTGDFSEALQALVGPQAEGLSASTVTRLKQVWEQEYEAWSRAFLGGEGVRLRVGRWHSLQRPLGRRSAVHPGVNGRHGRWPQGIDRLGRWLS